MQGTPKIRGYIANDADRVMLLYRQSNRVTYLAVLDYSGKHERVRIGSRFFGKFYPNRCDLSADGRFFLYFAQGKNQKQYDKKLYCWTGICRPPDVHALLLLSHNDTWGGGGRFVDDRKLIYVAPGSDPDFDISRRFTLENYDITFDRVHHYNDWTSGKGWKETFFNKFGIGEGWSKSRRGVMIERKVANKDAGEFSLHHYKVIDLKRGETILDGGRDIQWMDFDNKGRLILSRGALIEIYKNAAAIVNGSAKTIDLERHVEKQS